MAWVDSARRGVNATSRSVPHPDLPPDFFAFLDARPSFTYDKALAALAWLARGGPDDLDRATRLLDALLALQQDDGALPDSANAAAVVIDGAAPPLELGVVTQRTVPGLVTVSDVLDARVR